MLLSLDMKRVQGGRPARVTGSLAKGAACSCLTPLSEAVARHRQRPLRNPSAAVESRPRPRGAALVLRAVLRHGRARESLGICFRSRRAPGTSPRARVFCFCFKPCCLFGCVLRHRRLGYESTQLYSVRKNPTPNPLKSAPAAQPQPCREAAPPARSDRQEQKTMSQ